HQEQLSSSSSCLKKVGVILLSAAPVDLRGKVAIVTGASGGIGRSTAAALAANGATVVLAVRSPPLSTPSPSQPPPLPGNGAHTV
ncbi:hypothetical protein T484DRAFT_1819513, partial [Baffinella frigidus]